MYFLGNCFWNFIAVGNLSSPTRCVDGIGEWFTDGLAGGETRLMPFNRSTLCSLFQPIRRQYSSSCESCPICESNGQILLPIIVAIQEPPDEEFSGRKVTLTFVATFFALLPTLFLYRPSIATFLFAITSAYAFVKAMTCWQNFEDSPEELSETADAAQVKLLSPARLVCIGSRSPLSRLRIIALLLAFALGSFLVLYRRLFFAVPRTYWKYAVGAAPIESARMLLIFALVSNLSARLTVAP
jgi:hypothetical protein